MILSSCRNHLKRAYERQGGLYVRRPFIFWLASLIILILSASIVVQSDGADKNTIDQLIRQTKIDILNKKKKEKSVLGSLIKEQQELSKLEQNYGQIKEQLKFAKNKLNVTKQELQNLQNNLSELERDQQTRQELLNQRLVVIYKHGFQSYLEIVLNASDYDEFVNRFEALAYFIKNDLQLLDNIQTAKLSIKSKHTIVATKKQQVEHQYEKMAVLRDRVSQEQWKVSLKVGETKKELTTIQQDRAKLEKALEEYEQTSREIEAVIQKSEQKDPRLVLGTGHMMWPLRGKLSSGFGWRFHPVLRSKKFHNGQDIAVPSGTPVIAVDSGAVLVSGWQGGYGNYVAIDHGNGISTGYGHNSRLLVSVGDKVLKGQTIAISGSTGLSTGPHLHFEVRRNGVPVDPLPYLP
jgi:murein DD-endopeptidase MepM/ murein hydrolase activator NlpD